MNPYRHFAAIYDQVMDTVPYDEWVGFAHGLLLAEAGDSDGSAGEGEAGLLPAATGGPAHILDACCGTGNVALRLAQAGYRVTGVDQSEAMLQQAARKERQAVEDGRISPTSLDWSCQDVRSLRLPEPVDAAFCLYDSLNYMLTPEDLEAALKAIGGALRPGGLLVFDAFQRWDRDREVPAKQIIQGAGWSLLWENHFDRPSRRWRIELKGVVREDGRRHRFTEHHDERAYSTTQVKKALTDAGWHRIRAYDGFAARPATRSTERVVYLARRDQTS